MGNLDTSNMSLKVGEEEYNIDKIEEIFSKYFISDDQVEIFKKLYNDDFAQY